MHRRQFLSLALLIATTSCAAAKERQALEAEEARANMIDSVVGRTAFETGCPEEKINARYIDPTTIGVEACDHKLVFIILPNAAGADCGNFENWGRDISGGVKEKYPRFCNAVLNSIDGTPASE